MAANGQMEGWGREGARPLYAERMWMRGGEGTKAGEAGRLRWPASWLRSVVRSESYK